MFTGLVEEIGEISEVAATEQGLDLVVDCRVVLSGTNIGDSIAVDGVCLTVTRLFESGFACQVMAETVRVVGNTALAVGRKVNLERAVALGGRLGGHVVQGHVDGRAALLSRTDAEAWDDYLFSYPPGCERYIAHKGAIAIDGASLTVTSVGAQGFGVSLIPQTLEATTLSRLGAGDEVNIETDVMARYLDRLNSVYAENHHEKGTL